MRRHVCAGQTRERAHTWALRAALACCPAQLRRRRRALFVGHGAPVRMHAVCLKTCPVNPRVCAVQKVTPAGWSWQGETTCRSPHSCSCHSGRVCCSRKPADCAERDQHGTCHNQTNCGSRPQLLTRLPQLKRAMRMPPMRAQHPHPVNQPNANPPHTMEAAQAQHWLRAMCTACRCMPHMKLRINMPGKSCAGATGRQGLTSGCRDTLSHRRTQRPTAPSDPNPVNLAPHGRHNREAASPSPCPSQNCSRAKRPKALTPARTCSCLC